MESFCQNFLNIEGEWNGGMAFGGEYTDSILLFKFGFSEFHFQYGPNEYKEYSAYQVNGDTLTLIQNNGHQEAAFRVETLNDSILRIQAINWPAVYISNTLCSPWTNAEKPKIPISEDYDTQSILENEVLRTGLEFERIRF